MLSFQYLCGFAGTLKFDLRLALVKSIGTLLKEHADYEGRSINAEVLYFIRQAIKEHEKDVEKK